MSFRYLHYDVFTSQPLLGNQLAVFTEARGLTTAQMQAIAREINFSETTFVLPAERPDTDVRMRIFTPYVEMPMAGHPTVGSTFALAYAELIPRGSKRFVFGLNVGPTPVDLEWERDRLRFVWMTQANPAFGPIVSERAMVAGALGLRPDDLVDTLPIQEVSCGVPFLMVPVRGRDAVDRASASSVAVLDLPILSRAHPAVFVFAHEGSRAPADTTIGDAEMVYSRMFAPALGVVEDPATGSASGPLGCYLVQHRCLSAAAAGQLVSIQGVKMGRASRIHIAISGGPDAITGVKVGGEAVLVAQGEFLALSAAATASVG
jgi:trans-2,3-dihydro-3-hydroxyanthranilate isomerase